MIYHMSGSGGAPTTPPVPTITIAPSNWTVTSEYSLPRGKVLADTKKSATVSLPTQTGSAPSIGVSANGLITSSYSVPSGKLLSSGASTSAQLATQGGYTVMPGTSDVTAVAQGRYTTGNIYVKGDSNLVSSNIISGKSIFGVSGSAQSADSVANRYFTVASASSTLVRVTFSSAIRIIYLAIHYNGVAQSGTINDIEYIPDTQQKRGYIVYVISGGFQCSYVNLEAEIGTGYIEFKAGFQKFAYDSSSSKWNGLDLIGYYV